MTGEGIMLLLVVFVAIFHAVHMGDRILRKRAEWKRTCAMITAVMNGAARIE